MKTLSLASLSFTALLVLSGCATPHVVETTRVTDSNLSCTQLEAEMKDADRFRTDAQKEKGMTGTNVAAVLLFWPAMIGTYSNANEAIAAADSRKVNLMNLYNTKKCSEIGQASGKPAVETPQTPEARLKSLKAMLDQNLITQTEYEERRTKIVAAM
jgi:hypothetical protein